MFTKTSFLLSGNEQLPEWVVKVSQRPDLSFSFNEADSPFLMGAPWPIIASSQLPFAWLDKDPGFPVLLRDFSVEVAQNRSWIYLPAHPDALFERSYWFRSNKKLKIESSLIIFFSYQEQAAEEIASRYPERDFRFVMIDRSRSSETLRTNEFQRELYFYQTHWRPDSVFNLAFNKQESFSPWVLMALHQGAILENNYEPKLTPHRMRKTWYGDWLLGLAK
jgi:hypothetical protein